MPDRTAATLARTVRAAVRRVAKPAPDADLLAAFVRTRDPAAFEALVRRHGPLVLAACRAVLADPADADDACQAAFVVLHRKAHTVRDGRTLGGWLFRVARRAAVEVKTSAERRRDRETKAARPEPVGGPDLSWREACAVLHEELDRLPPRYRTPVILCYLEGKTQDEAARELGWTVDSLRGRIHRGRLRLRARLEKRGVTLSAGLLAAVAVPAGAPPRVFAAVIAPSPAVAAVAQAVASTTRAWTLGAGMSLAAGLLIGVVVLGSGLGAAPPAAPPAKDKPADPTPPAAHVDALGDPLPDGAVARLGTVRFSHGEQLRALVFAPDGKTVVSVGNGTARVWDAATGAELRQFSTGTTDWDEQAVVTPDDKQLVLLIQRFKDDPVRRFDLATGKPAREVTLSIHRGEMSVTRRNALSPDGRLAALPAAFGLTIHDTATGKALWADPRGSNLTGFSVGPIPCPLAFAGPDVLACGLGFLLQVREARTGKVIHQIDSGGYVATVAASADGRWLATLPHHDRSRVDAWPERDTIRLWDVATGTRKHELTSGQKGFFMNLAFSSDGKRLAAYRQSPNAVHDVTVWDTAAGKPVANLPGVVGQVLAFSPDGKRLAAGPNVGKFDVYDVATGKPTGPADPLGWWAGAVHLSRTGDRAVTVSKTAVTTWDATTGRLLQSAAVPEHLFEKPWCRLSPDGQSALLVRTGKSDGSITVWDVAAGKARHTIPVAGDTHGALVAFAPDSTRFAVRLPGKNAPASVRDVSTGKEVASIPLKDDEHPGQFFFTDDGRTLFVAGKRTVAYDLAAGTERFAWTMDPVPVKDGMQMVVGGANGAVHREVDRPAWRSLTISADGTLAAGILSAGWAPDATVADRIVLCDARTGKAIRRWGDSGKQSNGHEVLAFSPDGRLLATSDKYDVHVWEVGTGSKVRTFRGHRSEVEALAFSGNGRRLASAAHDGTVLVWDVSAPSKPDADPWAALASSDAATGYAAVARLADAADDVTIPLLRKHLRPLTAAESERIARLVANLDSDEFRVRERSQKELTDLGHAAGPALRPARRQKPSAELVTRLDQLLAKQVGPPSSGESLRTWRALAALEAKGTAEAKALLRELAAGADGWLTAEARSALKRMEP